MFGLWVTMPPLRSGARKSLMPFRTGQAMAPVMFMRRRSVVMSHEVVHSSAGKIKV